MSPSFQENESLPQECENLIEKFEAQLANAENPRIEDVVNLAEPRWRPRLLRELVLVDLERRRKRGENCSVEEFLERFPELRDDESAVKSIIRQEYLHCEHKETAAAAFMKRFPDYGEWIHRNLVQEATPQLTDDTPADLTNGVETSATYEGEQPNNLDEMPEQFGRYRLTRFLGGGGMGKVYLAHDEQLGRTVALKFPKFSENERSHIERFYREARAMASVDHPGLCAVHDVGEINGQHFISMAFIDGEPLSSVLSEARPIESCEAARIIRSLASALHRVHQAGVVHRDLKPSNVMIDPTGEPVIMDFGLARHDQCGNADLTATGVLVGTPAYMAQEQVKGDRSRIGPGTDIYALGVILYQMLCGRKPYEGSPMEVLGDVVSGKVPPAPSKVTPVDSRLESICLRAMAPRIEDRFSSADELVAALDDYLVRLSSTSPAKKNRTSWSSHRSLQVAVGLGMLAIVAATIWLVYPPKLQGNIVVSAPVEIRTEVVLKQDGALIGKVGPTQGWIISVPEGAYDLSLADDIDEFELSKHHVTVSHQTAAQVAILSVQPEPAASQATQEERAEPIVTSKPLGIGDLKPDPLYPCTVAAREVFESEKTAQKTIESLKDLAMNQLGTEQDNELGVTEAIMACFDDCNPNVRITGVDSVLKRLLADDKLVLAKTLVKRLSKTLTMPGELPRVQRTAHEILRVLYERSQLETLPEAPENNGDPYSVAPEIAAFLDSLEPVVVPEMSGASVAELPESIEKDLESDNPAVALRAKIALSNREAMLSLPKRLLALRYLSTVQGSWCYPGVRSAVLASRDDEAEEVRVIAAKSVMRVFYLARKDRFRTELLSLLAKTKDDAKHRIKRIIDKATELDASWPKVAPSPAATPVPQPSRPTPVPTGSKKSDRSSKSAPVPEPAPVPSSGSVNILKERESPDP